MFYINNMKFSLKELRCAENNGVTLEELASNYGITEEEFIEKLREITKNDFAEHRRILERNSKLHKRHQKPIQEENNNMEIIKACDKVTDVEVEITRESILEQIINTCTADIESLNAKLNQSEDIIKLADSEIEKIKNELLQIAETVKEKRKVLFTEEAKKTTAQADIQLIEEEICKKEAELKEAEEELDSYRAIIISFVSNVVVVSKDGYTPSAKDIEEKSTELVKLEVFDDYAVKHIKQAAEVLCVVDYVKVMELQYSIDYTNCQGQVKEILEEVFRAA